MQNASTVHITFDGQPMEVPAGISVAAAVLRHAHLRIPASIPWTAAPALLTLMGVLRMPHEIDGEPDVQSCSSPCGKAWL
ncbi:MAG: 2Fe-2S iron-sulfur cluster-binding protein [Bilophila wadsworthia]